MLSLLATHASVRPNQVALSFEGHPVTYGELADLAQAVANRLRCCGAGAGSRIAYLGENSDAYFILLYGAAIAGAVMVPISWRLTEVEIAYILEDSAARLMFADDNRLLTAKAAAARAGGRIEVVPCESDKLGQWCAQAETAVPNRSRCDPLEPLIQLYTSGTTGRPKGVALTHENIFRPRPGCASGEVPWDRWTSTDVGLVTMPIAHIAGTSWGTLALNAGATSVIVRGFDARAVLKHLREDRVSKIFLVPAALRQILAEADLTRADFNSVGSIYYGASPITLPLLQQLMSRLDVGLCQLYGLTETSGAIVGLKPQEHDASLPARLAAAGRALPGVELRIVDATGQEVPLQVSGEIVTRSAGNMGGYWRMPQATAAALDAEGWLRTGDVGFVDADGYLFIRDRIKDMIVSGGENVYPVEIESVLQAHPDIHEVAVIGVPDDRWGEAVKAVVVLKPGATATEADILAHARRSLAGFKVPKSVDFTTSLPRTASGKLLKRELRSPYWPLRSRQVN